jgi:2-polyprenyl-3-methyl-5-hydroxy-6-metoxy-1,4-benzoquinol methylase
MHYDPIKRSLGEVFNKTPFLRKLFYHLLDLLLLRSWHIHKELKKWMQDKSNDMTILDAGAGFGQYSYWLACQNKYWNIYSVDVKEEQVADCNNFFNRIGFKNVKFGVEDLTVYRKENAYDLVVCVDVMEHILEDEKVFSNYVASLKKGGMLIISTPSDQGGSDVHGDDETSFIEEHVRDGYNIDAIKQKLLSAGFAHVEARYSYGNPGKVSWRLSMKYPILMLGFSKLFFLLLPFYYLVFFPICLLLNYLDTHQQHTSGTGLIVKAWK